METTKEHDDMTNKPLENPPFTVESFDEPTYISLLKDNDKIVNRRSKQSRVKKSLN